MAAGVLLAFFALAEGAARELGVRFPAWTGQDRGMLMVGHPTRLWALAPGRHDTAGAAATVNPLGLRGSLPELPRPPGRERVLVLGDSSFFGHGLADADTLDQRLGEALGAAGVAVDTVNGAVPGYSTEQGRRLLDELGWATEPTLLLVGHLWSDNNIDAFRDRDLLASAAAAQRPLYRSALVRLTAGWIDRARGGEGARLVTWTHDSAWPQAQDRRVPVQDYAANLDGIVRQARARGVGVAFVAPVNRGLAEGRYPPGEIWDVYFAAQAQVAAHHGLPVVSARAALAADDGPVAELFLDVMHPSARGAACIAAEAARVVRDAGWPSARLLGRAEPFDPRRLVDHAREQAPPSPREASIQATLLPAGR